MTPTSLWPIIEFIGAFGLGVGLGSWDLIRVKVGVPTQPPSRRSAVIVQSLGIVMLILVGSTTYEQHRDSEARQHDADCQSARNQEFSDGIKARADAQEAFRVADEQFTTADEAWVADQILVLRASKDRTLTQAQRDVLTDRWLHSLEVKRQSALAKSEALRTLGQVRTDNPIDPPRDC